MSRLALCDVSGPLTDLLQKLSGEDGEQWMRATKKMLRRENPWEGLSIWKTIKLGTGLKTADDFRRSLKDNGNCIGGWANDLLGKSEFENSVSKEEAEVDLVIFTTAQLTGKANGGTTAEVFAGAERLGLKKCSAEVGPQLRRQNADQPNGERLLIGMEPIRDSDGDLSVFNVVHDDNGRWLNSYYDNPVNVWLADSRWVFVRPRK